MFGKNNGLNNLMHRSGNVQNHFIDTLINLGFVNEKQVRGLETKKDSEIVKILLNGVCTAEQIAKTYSTYFDLPFVKLSEKTIDNSVLKLIPKDDAQKYKLVAFLLENNNLSLALGNPDILEAQAPEVLGNLATKGYKISLSIASVDEIDKVINQYDQIKPDIGENNKVQVEGSSQATQINQGSDFIDLKNIDIPMSVLMKFPKEVAEKYHMVVFDTDPPINISTVSKKIKVALLDPNDVQAKEILEFIKKRNNLEVQKFKCDQTGLDKALSGYWTGSEVSKKTDQDNEGDSGEKNVMAQTEKIEAESKDSPEKQKPGSKTEKQSEEMTDNKKEAIPSEDNLKNDDELSDSKDRPTRVKEIDESEVKADPLPTEKKVSQMQAIATSVLKPEQERLKEGIATPYNPPAIQKPKEEAIPEVKSEDIDQSSGLTPEASMDDNLEDNNLDRFLSRPINTVEDLESVIKAGMIPEIVAGMVSLAIVMQVSDIHIEAAATNVRIRYRVDGILRDIIKMPLSLHAPLISRIKILSKLKIDEQRVPQDGRFDVIVRQHEIDLRVSTLPTVHGEKVVMRILDKSEGLLTLEDMGITGGGFDVLIKNIKKPYGIILATGPTGSGKSTTLYAILQRISTPAVNVITLEDPVEYEIAGINQTQVKPQIGFTFAEGLRSVLRQDPNIVMVGEIRDLETAAMATHAALTGHLVLSTLHTNDSAGALPRLINMGVEPFLITSSVNCIIAQRLVRKICPKCKEKITLPDALVDELMEEISKIADTKISNMKKESLSFYHGKGCSECNNGYHGRIGIFEVLEMNEKIESLAVEKQPSSAISTQACKDGMITMKQDGILKAMKGITTIDEVLRVTSSD